MPALDWLDPVSNMLQMQQGGQELLCIAVQVWLSLVNLLVEPACRAKYNPDEYRYEAYGICSQF